jgi:ubiquinone/menaquinone biosynthesis C-methylase UbiE
MIRLAKLQLRQMKLNVDFLDLPRQQIPLNNEAIETVVSTFTLCIIHKVEDALHDIKRVLKPGGKLIFFELGLSPDPPVRRWQKLFEPIAQRAFEGLSLTRDIPSFITQGGFLIEQLETGYIAPFPKSWTYCFWGNALL